MGEDSNMASRALTRCPRSLVPGCCWSRFRLLCEAALVDFRCRNERSTRPGEYNVARPGAALL